MKRTLPTTIAAALITCSLAQAQNPKTQTYHFAGGFDFSNCTPEGVCRAVSSDADASGNIAILTSSSNSVEVQLRSMRGHTTALDVGPCKLDSATASPILLSNPVQAATTNYNLKCSGVTDSGIHYQITAQLILQAWDGGGRNNPRHLSWYGSHNAAGTLTLITSSKPI